MNSNIEARTLELLYDLTLDQIFKLIDFFGFDHKNDVTW